MDEFGAAVVNVSLGAYAEPRMVAYDPADGDFYIAGYGTAETYVLNATNDSLSATLEEADPIGVAYDSQNECIYVVDPAASSVWVYNGTQYVTRVSVSAEVYDIAYDSADQDLYVTDELNNEVWVISGATNAVLARVHVGTEPVGVTYDSKDQEIFVGNYDSSNVSVLQGTAVVATVGGLYEPFGLGYDPVNDDIYVSQYGARMALIDGATDLLVGSNLWPILAPAMAFDSGNGELYLSNVTTENVSVIGPSGRSALDVIDAGIARSLNAVTTGIAYDPQNGKIVVANTAGNSAVIIDTELAVGQVVPTARGLSDTGRNPHTFTEPGVNPEAVAYDDLSNRVFVSEVDSDDLIVFNGTSDAEVGQINIGTAPGPIAYDSSNGLLYVTNPSSDTLTVLNGSNDLLVGTIVVGSTPELIQYVPVTGDLYVFLFDTPGLVIVSGLTDHVIGSVSYDMYEPLGMTYDPWNDDVYVVGYNISSIGEITVIDGVTNTFLTTFALGAQLDGATFDPANGDLYVTDITDNFTYVVSAATDALLASIAMPDFSEPAAVLYDEANGYVYVDLYHDAEIDAIDTANDQVLGALGGIDYPEYMAYNPSNSQIWATTATTDQIFEFQTLHPEAAATTATLDVGQILLLQAPVLGQGSLLTNVSVTVLPNATLSCLAGSLSAAQLFASCHASTYGAYNVTLTAYDALGYSVSTNLTVRTFWNPAVNSIVPSAPGAEVGHPISLTADAVNGTGIYSFTWAPPVNLGCAATNASVLVCTPADAGPEYVSVQATDSDGVTSMAGTSLALTVYAAVSVSTGDAYLRGDATWGNVSGSVSTGSTPAYEAYDPENGYLYVTDSGAAAVTVISGSTDAVVATIGVGSLPIGIAYDPLDGRIFVANFASENVSVISQTTNAVIANIPVGLEPYGLSYDSANDNLYLACAAVDLVEIISGAGDNVIGSISGFENPLFTLYDGENGYLYVTEQPYSLVAVVSTSTDSIVSQISGLGSPRDLALDPANGNIYVANYYGETVGVVSGTTNTVIAQIGTGPEPGYLTGIAYDSATGDVYATISTSYYVAVISGSSDTLAGMVFAEYDPYGVAYDAATSALWVTNYLSSTTTALPTLVNQTFPAAPTFDVGQTVLLGFGANPGAGMENVTLAALPNASLQCRPETPDNDGVYAACSATVPGSYTLNVTLTDALGFSASALLTVVVSWAPELSSLVASVASVDAGHPVTFSTSASRGTGVYTQYIWSSSAGLGCATSGSPTDTCIPSIPGTYSILAEVTDSNRDTSAPSTIASYHVWADPTISTPIATSGAVDLGQSFSLSAVATNGTGLASTYAWQGLPSGCASENATSLLCTPTATGAFMINASINDSNGVNVTSPSLTVVVSPALGSAGLIANVTDLDEHQTTQLSASISGGTQSYNYNWTGLPAGCSNANVSILDCTPTAPGSYVVKVFTNDSNGATSNATVELIVSADPTLGTPGATLLSLDVGQTTHLSDTATNGTGLPSTYTWNGLPTGCASSGALVDPCTPTATGSFLVTLTITDSNGFSLTSGSVAILVSADPTIGIPTATHSSLDVGQSTVLTSIATNGTGLPSTYLWTGLPAGCSSQSTLDLTCAPTVSGTFHVGLSIKDSNGDTVASAGTLALTVSPALVTPTLTASVPALDVGQTLSLKVAESGGTGSYAYTWSGLPVGCSSSDLAWLNCTPNGIGSGLFHVAVSVTDGNGRTLSSVATTISVSADPTIGTPGATRLRLDLGQTTQLSDFATNGTGLPSTYVWNGLPTGCASSGSLVEACNSTVTGTFHVTISITDSNGFSLTSSALTLVISLGPTIGTPTAKHNPIYVGDPANLSVVATNGTGLLGTYAWLGLPGGCSSVNASRLRCFPVAAGTFSISVAFTDSNGVSATSAPLSFEVIAQPEISIDNSTRTDLDLGQTLTLSATATNGTGLPSVYAWEGLPLGCASQNALIISCVPAATGTYNITASIEDSNGINVTSAVLEVSISPALGPLTISASRSGLDEGQNVTLTATVSGGSSPIVAWAGLPSGCRAVAAGRVSCVQVTMGSFTVEAWANDSNGESQSATYVLEVSADPTLGTPASSRVIMDVGQSVVLTDTATNATGLPSVYAWTGLPASCSSADALTITCTPGAPGSYRVTVSITDSNGFSVTSSPVEFIVSIPPETPQLSLSSASVQVGGTVVLSLTVRNGTAPYSFVWSGLPAGCASTNASVLDCTPTETGTFSISVTATDAAGVSVTSGTEMLVVHAASSPASGWSTGTWLVVAGAAAVAVLVGALLFWFLMSSGGKKGESEDKAEDADGKDPDEPAEKEAPAKESSADYSEEDQ